MYQKSLKGMNWTVLCFGMLVCAVSLGAVAEAHQSLKDKCLTENYPPPPEDKSQLPDPVKSCIQMIANLCQHDEDGRLTLTLEEQAPLLQSALKGLRKALPYYINHYSKQVNSTNLRRIRSNVLNGTHIRVFWRRISTSKRGDFAGHFLKQRTVSHNLESDAGPESFFQDWEYQIYNGLYCFSYENLPPAFSFPVKNM